MLTAVAMLDNRKLSILLWILAALIFCIVKRDIRASLIGVVKAALAPRIALPLAGMSIYIGAIITGLWAAGLWTLDSAADTVFWLTGSGLVLFFVAYDRVRTDPRFFRRTATRTLSVVVVVGFLVDLFPLPLPAELLLVPFLFLLGATLAFASTRADLAPVSHLLNGVVAIIGWALLVYGAARVAADPGSFASIETARTFAIPLLLTLTFLPFVYTLAVYANLDSIRAELRWILGDDTELYRYARRRVLLTTGLRLRSVLRATARAVAPDGAPSLQPRRDRSRDRAHQGPHTERTRDVASHRGPAPTHRIRSGPWMGVPALRGTSRGRPSSPCIQRVFGRHDRASVRHPA